MADLFVLLQDLGDRIANKGDTQYDEDDAVESRFRKVLPGLLERSFSPSKAKERELVAILKLLCMMVKHFPGVFYKGKKQAILPILGHIIPLFAEWELRSCHDGLFNVWSAFMSLLRSGDLVTYKMIFMDCMLLVEDLAGVASFYSTEIPLQTGTNLSIKSFSKAYAGLSAVEGQDYCLLRGNPQMDQGLIIKLTGDTIWQGLAEATVKIMGQCLQEEAIRLDGLLTPSFISEVATLFCYGNPLLQSACFDFIRITTSVMEMETFPSAKLIMSIVTIISLSGGNLLPFRTAAFDSTLGGCLFALCSTCERGTLERVAQAFVDVMPQTVKETPSRDLKVFMCEVFSLILRECPAYASKLSSILELMCIPGIGSSLSYCLQLAMKVLGPAKVAGETKDPVSEDMESPTSPSSPGTSSVAADSQQSQEYQRRPAKRARFTKRQDLSSQMSPVMMEPGTSKPAGGNDMEIDKLIDELHLDSENPSPALSAQKEALRLMKEMIPLPDAESATSIEGKLTGLSVLAELFGKLSETVCHKELIQLLQTWLLWALKKANDSSLMMVQLSMILEALEKMVVAHGQGSDSGHAVPNVLQQFLLGTSEHKSLLQDVLLLPWSLSQNGQESLSATTKCRAVWITAEICGNAKDSKLEGLIKKALQDENPRVRAEAISAVPRVTRHAGSQAIRSFCEVIRSYGTDDGKQVRTALATVIGFMTCLYHYSFLNEGSPQDETLQGPNGHKKPELEETFICRWCNGDSICSNGANGLAAEMPDNSPASLLGLWEPLFSQLLFNESTEQVQVSFIGSMSPLLHHARTDEISGTREHWSKALDVLPVHKQQSVREAFGSQIELFTKSHVLAGIFGAEAAGETNQELQMLGILKHALSGTRDPDVVNTLVETVARVASVASVSSRRRQLLFFSLVLLLEQLDSKDLLLRVKSVKLICGIGPTSSQHTRHQNFQAIVDSIREELFEYLINRLLTRPLMIQEFAEAVIGVKFEDLLKQMVPVVLPKLVLNQQHSQQALATLHELAKRLTTDLPLLLLEWCHKVLSVLLLRADGVELMAALQFYESQTGSDPREIFAAVLPALLDELVRFLGDTDSEEALRRSARVAPMIQEVASIVTGSDDLPDFLRGHFVGLLNSIDRKLLRADDIASQKQALNCIERLVEMIGSHLSAFVPKIMALLTQALQDAPLQVSGLKVWLSFVRTMVQTAPASAKNVASQIVVSLMPCLEGSQDEQAAVVEVLEELIVKNETVLGEQAKELPILPSLPSLSRVNAVLLKARGSLSLRDQLRRAADGLTHESMSVRYMTGNEVRKFMQSRRTDMTVMLAGESTADVDVVSKLVTALLKGCAEESRTAVSQKLKMACAECLGELGAVDPVKLKVDLRHQSRMERSNEDLIVELINEHLARVLRAATDTDIQDAAALAIQELLKLSGCRAALLDITAITPSDSSKTKEAASKIARAASMKGEDTNPLTDSGEQLWRRFADDVKEIITPCLTSKYFLRKSGASIPEGPIYQKGMSFRRWMYLWIRRLISQSVGQRAEIFTACTSVVRHDMGTALYLLPYLVLNIVCDGTIEARTSVTDEILAVLADAASLTSTAVIGPDGRHGNVFKGLSGPSEVSTQTVFSLIDNLGQWLDDCKQSAASNNLQAPAGSTRSNSAARGDGGAQFASHRQNVQHLLAAIPKQALAGASFRCRAYARALLYFETHVREKSGAINPASVSSGFFADEDVTFLLEIYSGLDEADGLSGLSRLRTATNLKDQVLINEKAGNWAEAVTCYEQALQMEPTSVIQQSGVLDCLLNMGHLQSLITHVDGLISRLPDRKREWSMWGIQAAWRLGQWDLLEEYVAGVDGDGSLATFSEGNSTFDKNLALILQALQKKDLDLFTEQIMYTRQALLAPLAAAGMESYARAYPLIVKLHMLQELEDFSLLAIAALKEAPHGDQLSVSMTDLLEHWESRLKTTQPSLWAREPILALRRLILSANELHSEVGICWLQYAKLCRAAGHYETANRAILQAQSVGAPNAHMEMAKLLWDTKKSHRAILELQQALTNVSRSVLGNAFDSALSGVLHIHGQSPMKLDTDEPHGRPGSGPAGMSTQVRRDKDLETAKTLLLLAKWVHHTGQMQKDDVVSLYSRVKELQPKWEKGFFFMAKYFDDLLVDARRRQEENQEGGSHSLVQKRNAATNDKLGWDLLPELLLFYAKGLHKGHIHLFQAMPRLLTLWFEFGSQYYGDSLASNRGVRGISTRVMGIIRGCLKDLPTYQWLTSLPQLVSRICHHNDEVVRIVKHIITSVLQTYPQQALWIMAAVTKSNVAARREAAAEIIQQAKSSLGQDREKSVLFTQFANLIDQMIRLCNFAGQPRAKSVSLAADFSYLKRLMPVGVIMPLQRALFVTLPPSGVTDLDYEPFPPTEFSTISGIEDEIEILASLQKPKKVVLLASDGMQHPFLCKPKDDLRKDARMMEFTTMINRLLSKDPNSRRRNLYIRTFAVVPLTEDCGMIEWVLHTRGLRHILQDVYVACGKFDRQKTNPTIKRIYDQQQSQRGAEKMSEAEMLETKILPMFPPVFHRWFLNTFPEPAAWFQARVAYAHTTAVWSMVGHIVGLGDRHGENILFDSTTGDCVHVDFSCLFDKGLQLEKPELVPFRLTQNMVDGLGITGYEGIFLRVCEITLGVLRTHRETLMIVLETFIHDPLVEWTKSHKSSCVEVQNPHAQKAIANIEARLEGVVVGVAAAPSLPLSVEGQAHRLIAEAVSHQNLGKMYIWWMPWF